MGTKRIQSLLNILAASLMVGEGTIPKRGNTMSAHTPAPWTVTRGFNIKGADGTHIAQILDNDNVMLDDNANLIAAAPTMLAALEAADKWVAMYLGMEGHDAAARSMLAVIRAATAKAKGE
jgi:hypothetical protein